MVNGEDDTHSDESISNGNYMDCEDYFIMFKISHWLEGLAKALADILILKRINAKIACDSESHGFIF